MLAFSPEYDFVNYMPCNYMVSPRSGLDVARRLDSNLLGDMSTETILGAVESEFCLSHVMQR